MTCNNKEIERVKECISATVNDFLFKPVTDDIKLRIRDRLNFYLYQVIDSRELDLIDFDLWEISTSDITFKAKNIFTAVILSGHYIPSHLCMDDFLEIKDVGVYERQGHFIVFTANK